MSFQDKLEVALQELSETQIRKSSDYPPICILLRKSGLPIRPFHYN